MTCLALVELDRPPRFVQMVERFCSRIGVDPSAKMAVDRSQTEANLFRDMTHVMQQQALSEPLVSQVERSNQDPQTTHYVILSQSIGKLQVGDKKCETDTVNMGQL